MRLLVVSCLFLSFGLANGEFITQAKECFTNLSATSCTGLMKLVLEQFKKGFGFLTTLYSKIASLLKELLGILVPKGLFEGKSRANTVNATFTNIKRADEFFESPRDGAARAAGLVQKAEGKARPPKEPKPPQPPRAAARDGAGRAADLLQQAEGKARPPKEPKPPQPPRAAARDGAARAAGLVQKAEGKARPPKEPKPPQPPRAADAA